MNDKEIIKALECCFDHKEGCDKCPIEDECLLHQPQPILLNHTLDLINRQQAEIETQSQNFKMLVSDHRCLQQYFDNLKGLYQAEKEKVESAKSKSIYFAKELQKARAEINRVTALAAEWKDAAYTYADNIDKIKAEAIKEFAKKIRQKIYAMVCSPDLLTLDDYDKCIDDVLKEMVGEKNEIQKETCCN